MLTLSLLAGLSLAAWLFMLLFWGGFWRADVRLPPAADPAAWPAVAGVVPARDEADSIGAVVQAHLAARYPGDFHLVVVDDNSADGTAVLARAAGAAAPERLTVTPGRPLPAGWTGKLWAQQQGVEAARAQLPHAKYLLLCDADIVFGPDTLRRLAAQAEHEEAALVSLMARLDARGFWASLLIPAFILFFQKLYPFAWSNRPERRWLAAAAGGVMLVRAEAAAALDLPASIRGALIDDCSLAARIKRSGRTTWIGLAREGEAVSLRDNRGFASIWSMVARTAYAQLGKNPLLLLGCLAGLALLYLAGPVVLLTWAWHRDALAAGLGLAAWAAMTLAFLPTCLDYRRPWAAPLLPLAGLLYGLMTFDSARRSWLGRGGAWKGRTYPGG
jgi:hopene-associated glycosyltransferase HpnB